MSISPLTTCIINTISNSNHLHLSRRTQTIVRYCSTFAYRQQSSTIYDYWNDFSDQNWHAIRKASSTIEWHAAWMRYRRLRQNRISFNIYFCDEGNSKTATRTNRTEKKKSTHREKKYCIKIVRSIKDASRHHNISEIMLMTSQMA